MAGISNILLKLDIPQEDTVQIKLFKLRSADCTDVANDLLALFPEPKRQANQPNRNGGRGATLKKQAAVNAVPDPRTKSVLVTAPKDTMIQITRIVDEMDNEPARSGKSSSPAMKGQETPEPVPLETRMFHVNPDVFVRGLEKCLRKSLPDKAMHPKEPESPTAESAAAGWLAELEASERVLAPCSGGPPFSTLTNATKDNLMVSRYFASLGINLTNNGAFVFFNKRTGDILVRTTAQDLDIVERAIEAISRIPPQVQIDVKFASIPEHATNRLGFSFFPGSTLKTNEAVRRCQRQPPHLDRYLDRPAIPFGHSGH